jgi:hypothetical protein
VCTVLSIQLELSFPKFLWLSFSLSPVRRCHTSATQIILAQSVFYPAVGSGDLRQMSEHPIPHGEHCDSCILRRTCKPAFLHPEVQICHRADEQNALKISPPPTRGKTNQFTQESPRIHANEKSPPNPHPNPELKVHKKPSLHLSSELPLSGPRCTALAVAFPFSLINPTSYTSFGSQVNQLPHEPVL